MELDHHPVRYPMRREDSFPAKLKGGGRPQTAGDSLFAGGGEVPMAAKKKSKMKGKKKK
jgi:hypothetical protein